MGPVAEISTALQDVSDLLRADGYRLNVRRFQDHHLTVAVEATSEACEDCLVPKVVMEGILRSKLPRDLHVARVEIIYPTDQ